MYVYRERGISRLGCLGCLGRTELNSLYFIDLILEYKYLSSVLVSTLITLLPIFYLLPTLNCKIQHYDSFQIKNTKYESFAL